MKILVDADACPVIKLTEQSAKKRGIPLVLLCDTNHVLYSDYAEIRMIGAGADAVDFALVNLCRKGDIVITQDFGVAAMALGRGAFCINQNGMRYTNDNIDGLLMDRCVRKQARMASGKNHLKGPKKRTKTDDEAFCNALEHLLNEYEIRKDEY